LIMTTFKQGIKEIHKGMIDTYQYIYHDHYQLAPDRLAFSEKTITADLLYMGLIRKDLKYYTVLNIGSGREACVFQKMGAAKVVHLDLSPFACESVNNYRRSNGCTSLETKRCDICEERLPWRDSINLCYLNGVVHHLYHPEQGIINCISTMPDKSHLFMRIYKSGSFYFFIVYILRLLINFGESAYFRDNHLLLLKLFNGKEHDFENLYDDLFVPVLNLFDVDSLICFLRNYDFFPQSNSLSDAGSYNHTKRSSYSFLPLHFVRNMGESKMRVPSLLKSVNQLTGIVYRENCINNSIDLFNSNKPSLSKLTIGRKALLAVELYLLAQEPLTSAGRKHELLQKILCRYSNPGQMK
jgi:hypothetical protein